MVPDATPTLLVFDVLHSSHKAYETSFVNQYNMFRMFQGKGDK